jgi:flagellar basal body-associated protein FliL
MRNNSNTSSENGKKMFSISEKVGLIILLVVASIGAGFVGGYYSDNQNTGNQSREERQQAVSSESELITNLAKEVGPSVVSINVTQELPIRFSVPGNFLEEAPEQDL